VVASPALTPHRQQGRRPAPPPCPDEDERATLAELERQRSGGNAVGGSREGGDDDG
jgi:hypothetical protein